MIPLREYQQSAINNVYQHFLNRKKVLLQMPTGAGKTVTFAKICHDAVLANRRFLVLVHRRELIRQAAAKLREFGIFPDIIMGQEQWSMNTGAYVASVQTLARRTMPDVDVLIIDEAHHATANTYQTIVEQTSAFVLGVTATPCRLNGKGFEDVFDELVLGPSIKHLAQDGFLVIPKVFAAPPPDTKGLHVRNGDYRQDEVANMMREKILFGDLTRMYRKYGQNGKLIGFAASVELSKKYAAEYRAAGISAAHVDGSTPEEERDRIFQEFRDGSIQAVWNYNIISEGFDVPDAAVVQIASPTKSLSKYMQMVGRIMRPSADKQASIVLDHAGVTFEHGFVQDDRLWTLSGIKKKPSPENGDFAETLELCGLCDTPRRIIALEKRQGIFHCEQEELCPLAQAAKQYKHDRDRELAEIPPEVYAERVQKIKRQHELERLFDIVVQREYRKADGKLNYWWAWQKFLEKVGTPTPEEIRLMRKRAGYHYLWEHRQIEQYNLHSQFQLS